LEFLVQEDYQGNICKKAKKLIWLATTWCIWIMRNNIMFNDDFGNVGKTLIGIKTLS